MLVTVKADALVKAAQKTIGWDYVYGKAETGKVDCSGLIVYLMRGLGGRVPYHGSNSMYRLDCDGTHLPVSQAKAGYLCFKHRPWTETRKTNRYYGKEPADIYHVGIMGADGKVINAANKKSGVIKSSPEMWDSCAKLKGVEYPDALSTSKLDELIAALDALLDEYRSD